MNPATNLPGVKQARSAKDPLRPAHGADAPERIGPINVRLGRAACSARTRPRRNATELARDEVRVVVHTDAIVATLGPARQCTFHMRRVPIKLSRDADNEALAWRQLPATEVRARPSPTQGRQRDHSFDAPGPNPTARRRSSAPPPYPSGLLPLRPYLRSAACKRRSICRCCGRRPPARG